MSSGVTLSGRNPSSTSNTTRPDGGGASAVETFGSATVAARPTPAPSPVLRKSRRETVDISVSFHRGPLSPGHRPACDHRRLGGGSHRACRTRALYPRIELPPGRRCQTTPSHQL